MIPNHNLCRTDEHVENALLELKGNFGCPPTPTNEIISAAEAMILLGISSPLSVAQFYRLKKRFNKTALEVVYRQGCRVFFSRARVLALRKRWTLWKN
jgi:hypothetical protein